MDSSEEVEWVSCIKPILTASYSNFNKSNLPNVIRAVHKSEPKLIEHGKEYEAFYSTFAALCTHYICNNITSLNASELSSATSACQILMNYLLAKLKMQSQTSTVSQKHLMILLKSLCKGSSSLSKSDVVTYTALLKQAKLPPTIRTGDQEMESAEESREIKRPRLDTGKDIFTQLTSVLEDTPAKVRGQENIHEIISSDGDTTISHIADPAEQIKSTFASRNMMNLQQLNGGDILLDVCSELPYLKRYHSYYDSTMQGKGLNTPTITSEAISVRSSLQSVLNDLSIVVRVFSLPILEPLTAPRLNKVISIAMACLHAAASAAMATSIMDMASTGVQVKVAGSKEDEVDTFAMMAMHRALEILSCVQTAIQQSTRTGGSHLRNVQLLAVWTELVTLQKMLNFTPLNIIEKAKDGKDVKSKESVQTQTKGPLGVLGVALASHAVKLLTYLMNDLEEEYTAFQNVSPAKDLLIEEVNVQSDYTALQRLSLLKHDVSLSSLLLDLMQVAFNKAVTLRSPHKSTALDDLCLQDMEDSSSDSNTYYEDDFSSSDHSTDEDDDSEPILGQLFEEDQGMSELPPPPPVPSRAEVKHKPARLNSSDVASCLPDRRDPQGYIGVATDVLHFFNSHIMGPSSPAASLLELTPANLTAVATVIKSLEKECPSLSELKSLTDFSVALARFTHNLIKTRLNTPQLQECLLSELGMSPQTTTPWPLYLSPRSLAVLTEIILLLQQQERQEAIIKAHSDTLITQIWNKFMEAIVEVITKEEDGKAQDIPDVNVEHCQVLVFLFHSLPLMQKKTLLLQLANRVCFVVNHFQKQSVNRLREVVPIAVARLLVIMDYLLHYFYDPPAALIDQVQWNLFGVYTKQGKTDASEKTHFPCREVQVNYMKGLVKKDATQNARFYNLATAEYSTQDAPKIDGLACSFLLSNPELLDYNLYYDACISLLPAGSKCASGTSQEEAHLIGCAVHYHMVVLWRLLGSLPPATQYLKQLEVSSQLHDAHILHSLRWLPRLAHNSFTGWVKDCLVKQGETTQAAEVLLNTVVRDTNSTNYDVRLAQHFIQGQIAVSPLAGAGEILPPSEMPNLSSVYMLDVVIAKVQVSLDELFQKSISETDPLKTMDVAQDLLPATLLLIEAYTIYIRSCLLNRVEGNENCLTTPAALQAYGTVLSIGSNAPPDMASFASSMMNLLPGPVKSVVEGWCNTSSNEFPAIGAWRNAFANDIIPVESYVSAILGAQLSTLSSVNTTSTKTGQTPLALTAALRHTLLSLVRFCSDLVMWCPDEASPKEMARVLLPLVCDVTTEYTSDNVYSSLERVIGAQDTPEFNTHLYSHVLNACCQLITTHANKDSGIDESILYQVLGFLEQQLEKTQGRVALHDFFTHKADLIGLLLSATSESLSPTYGTKVLKFFNKLFQLAEKFPNDKSYLELCSSLSRVAQLDSSVLQGWLGKMITSPAPTPTSSDGGVVTIAEEASKIQENRLLLQSITSYIVKDGSHVGEEVAKAILNALVPMGSQILSPTSEGIGFSELMVVMATLAGAGSGVGHLVLVEAVTGWLELCKTYLSEPRVLEKLEESVSSGKHHTMLESCCYLLSYIGDILAALKLHPHRATSPAQEGDPIQQEGDSDWAEDLVIEEEDSMGEDSDDERLLNSKLCTFTVTQKEFMNQHWYHCHTCKMVDGVGVCTVCAKVCHKDHDLSYAKYGSFFCDCGAKDNGTCQALVKRTSQSGLDSSSREGQGPSPFSGESMLTSSLRRRLQPLTSTDRPAESKKEVEKTNKAREALCKQIIKWKDDLLQMIHNSNSVTVVVELLQALMPTMLESYGKISPAGSVSRAHQALRQLQTQAKTCETTDQLMTATLGSQEGAFENVRMTFTGDQGQQIRQLITTHVVRRVAMCCLSGPHGKRQHLAVSHEKGKVTILQLSALLKQADSSKRKLTLTRLASAPVPFTVLSIAGNPCNEDFLAVCGLKECHVFTLSSSGSVSDHLVLHPSLDSTNFIIKAVWLPGSQTELAVVTADFVKIYDLSIDAISPQYYLLLPSGKVRDATFVCYDDSRSLVITTSIGYIYCQALNDQSSARHGPFYITNFLEVNSPEVTEQGGTVCGGGTSVYYSHMLQLLFFSYTQGQTFAAPVPKNCETLPQLFQITTKSNQAATNSTSTGGSSANSGSGNGKNNNTPQPLVGWCEVASHPGLVCAITQQSNNPVILMVKPDTILVQEIKVLPAKAKIQDMVVIRHSGHTDQRTTLILLCEDGSLKIYMANTDNTNYWLSPGLQPQNVLSVLRPTKKKRPTKLGTGGGQVNFPVDYFEHCTQSVDVEFGGNDLLQVYNTAQLKHRLNTTSMYIANTKPSGFTLEVMNTNNSYVMVGVRILVGSQSLERCPTSLEVFGRPTPVSTTRPRWIDLPFTKEESLTADKKFSLFVGVSTDPASVTMIDSVKVYIKTKESFGWPEDMEDFQEGSNKSQPPATTSSSVSTPAASRTYINSDGEVALAPLPMTSVDRLLASSLEVLDGCFCSQQSQADTLQQQQQTEGNDPTRQMALKLATQLLTLPTPTTVQQHTKQLLSDLFTSKNAYHMHKDEAQLNVVVSSLQNGYKDGNQTDPTDNNEPTVKKDEEVMSTSTLIQKGDLLDPEAFQRLLLSARSVAISRAPNLVKFAEKGYASFGKGTSSADEAELKQDFLSQMVDTFWRLHTARPANSLLAPACMPGLTHIEATIQAMVEIIHASTVVDLDCVPLAANLYIKLLLSKDPVVSFSCKHALVHVLRPKQKKKKVFIPSPPRCSTPGGGAVGQDDDEDDDDDDDAGDGAKSLATPQDEVVPPLAEQHDAEPYDLVEPQEPMLLDSAESGPDGGQSPMVLDGAEGGPGPMILEEDEIYEDDDPLGEPSQHARALEALLGGANVPGILDIPPDADDETMVELAIALSLQDQQGGRSDGMILQGLRMPSGAQAANLEAGQLSDATVSAPASDDEGLSTAATDGSNLRTSPAEQAGSAGSESGGSNIDSVSVSGRSSAYGEPVGETNMGRSETSSIGLPSSTGALNAEVDEQQDFDVDTTNRLHSLRLLLLQRMTEYLPELHDVGGVRAIPFMQVLLMLTSDLEGSEEKDKAVLDGLLVALIGQLNLDREVQSTEEASAMWCRSMQHEVELVMMRLLSVFMSRTKAGTKPQGETGSSFLSCMTAGALLQKGGLQFCLKILSALLQYWKRASPDEQEGSVLPGQLLKPHPASSPPDMSPFFLRQYVKGHAHDVFEDYPQLLTEMVLRLPYQMKKIAEGSSTVTSPTFDQKWFNILAEYMMTQQAPFVRRQVRKLLLYICGSKDKYRELRDTHALDTHVGAVRELCKKSDLENATPNSVILSYDVLIKLMEHLKAVNEIATSRTLNWQHFCNKDHDVLLLLVQAAIGLDEAVAPVLLQLLQCALCGAKGVQGAPGASPTKQKKEKENKEKDGEGSTHDEGLCMQLVQTISRCMGQDLLLRFMRCFLMHSNSTAVRWQAHALILHIYRCSNPTQQEALLDLLWGLWGELPQYGRKGAQFVDLLGYFSLKTPQSDKKLRQYIERAVGVLRGQNKLLANHPNGALYNLLQGLVELDGYYLESDPCLVCNNPEVPYANIKLSSLKVDSKFTTSTQIVKLVGSQTISKIILRITDLKRTKMVRTLNLYYNNRSVQAVVELKNKPGLWYKAKKVVLTTGQTEVKVEFPLPITACNLMIEYADFYDNLQGTAETLQCPRCSASVPANPGVCGNCGENVFQCHKCRAINYDEKDPFLCNACGFCKYAKFDFTLTAKACCAVDPIENDEDRKKAVTTINTLLEKADRLYRQLQLNRPALEALIVRVSEHSPPDRHDDSTTTSPGPGSGASSVNKGISQLAQKYCGDCRNAFEELSKVIQKVIATRRELVEYDRHQREVAAAAAAALPVSTPPTPDISQVNVLPSLAKEVAACVTPKHRTKRQVQCYGCASSTVEHCILLLRALSTNNVMRGALCHQGLIRELIEYNLKRGSTGVRHDVRQLLCLLTKDNGSATEELNNLITQRLVVAVKGHLANPDFAATVRHEMMLLANTVQKDDKCWEARIRTVLKLFLMSMKIRSPAVLEFVALPCLRILNLIIRPDAPTSKKHKDKGVEGLCSVKTGQSDLHVDVRKFMAADPRGSYVAWKHNIQPKGADWLALTKKKKDDKARDRDLEKRMARIKFLMEKYGHLWRQKTVMDKRIPLLLAEKTWLRHVMFSQSSRSTRQTACRIVEAMCQIPGRKKEIIDMLTSYLDDIGLHGESSEEYLALYKKLIGQEHWKFYLALKGVLTKIGDLINEEIEQLTELEDTSLSSDLSLGYALKSLTELLVSLVSEPAIKQHYKGKLVGVVLNGYLSLKRLVVQRTKLIDDTQQQLLELLEDMTTGTEEESKAFMCVCVDTIQKYPLADQLSPVFIFERMCNIIFPEENDVGEFFLSLEKDPQQEDFLQGRMLGNPYSCNEPGLGPLMRDVKNKICTDCELVALLEDDTGMELLVSNKIISLDLPVKDVYNRIWSVDHTEGEPMRVVYRMRGLLGDATEDMVNTLDSGKDDGKDEEVVYKLATVLCDNGGLRVMLQRLASIRDLVSGKQLLTVLLKLFSYAVKVKVNRQQLIRPEMNTISVMLGALNLALLAEQESGTSTKGQTLTEHILAIMEQILQEASSQSPESYKEFSKLCGDHTQLMVLLDRINSPFVRANPPVLQALMKLIPFLSFGDQDKMKTLINHFKSYLAFNKYDIEHTEDEEVHLDCLCTIADGIETNANGDLLKDLIVSHGIVVDAVEYIQSHAPEIKTLLATDSENWKEFLAKPALPFALRMLAGLSKGHRKTQMIVGHEIIPILHKLEQVSSQGSIGSLAENLMEALRGNQLVAEKIEEVRQKTKAEKKRLAMAVRQKQLGALGMTTNEKGQVKVKSSVLKQMEDLKEETGLVCCICREGYRYQPTKVLGIYTFTKRMILEGAENKPRKSQGYSTVSHFNVVHIDCHSEAVRHARGREEWESAALQNANTRCNGLLPLWGTQVAESAFANCLARHNTYLQECTGVRDASYPYTVHDVKHLVQKFAFESSFSEESGGGGRQSNIHMLPYMMHLALYVINTTRAITREEKNLNNFIQATADKWLENSFEPENSLYYSSMAPHIMPRSEWLKQRVTFLKRVLVYAQCRITGVTAGNSLSDKVVKEYSVYKPYLMFWALIGDLYAVLFKHVKSIEGETWSASLADYIRHNDQSLIQQSDKMMARYEEELLPVDSFMEFCDVTGMLEEITEPDKFLEELFTSVP